MYKVHGPEGLSDPPNPIDLPEHADNPVLNTQINGGILGFRYEIKDSSFVVYSTIETKTFCYIMKLTPVKN